MTRVVRAHGHARDGIRQQREYSCMHVVSRLIEEVSNAGLEALVYVLSTKMVYSEAL